jgi:hypothetical protein
MALAQRGCEYRSGVAPQEKAPRRAGQSFWSHLLAQFLMLSRSRPGSQKERRAGACGARPERMARPFLSGRRQRAEPINLLRCLRPRELRSSRPCVAGKPHNCFKVVSRAKPDSPATPPKGREIRARVSPRIVIVTRARAALSRLLLPARLSGVSIHHRLGLGGLGGFGAGIRRRCVRRRLTRTQAEDMTSKVADIKAAYVRLVAEEWLEAI